MDTTSKLNTIIDQFTNEHGRLDLESMLNKYDSISFFGVEEIYDNEFRTVYARTIYDSEVQLYIIEDYDNFISKKNKLYQIQDRESGNIIDTCLTLAEADDLLYQFEKEDKKDGCFEPNFYEIVEM